VKKIFFFIINTLSISCTSKAADHRSYPYKIAAQTFMNDVYQSVQEHRRPEQEISFMSLQEIELYFNSLKPKSNRKHLPFPVEYQKGSLLITCSKLRPYVNLTTLQTLFNNLSRMKSLSEIQFLLDDCTGVIPQNIHTLLNYLPSQVPITLIIRLAEHKRIPLKIFDDHVHQITSCIIENAISLYLLAKIQIRLQSLIRLTFINLYTLPEAGLIGTINTLPHLQQINFKQCSLSEELQHALRNWRLAQEGRQVLLLRTK